MFQSTETTTPVSMLKNPSVGIAIPPTNTNTAGNLFGLPGTAMPISPSSNLLFSPSGAVPANMSQFMSSSHHPPFPPHPNHHQFLFPPAPLPPSPSSLGLSSSSTHSPLFSPQLCPTSSASSSLSSSHNKFTEPYSSSSSASLPLTMTSPVSSTVGAPSAHFPSSNFFPDLPTNSAAAASSSYWNPYLHHFLLNNPKISNNLTPSANFPNLNPFAFPFPPTSTAAAAAAAAASSYPPFAANFPQLKDDQLNLYGGIHAESLSKSLYPNPYWIGPNSLYPKHHHPLSSFESASTGATSTISTPTSTVSAFGSPSASDYIARNPTAALYENFYSNYMAALNASFSGTSSSSETTSKSTMATTTTTTTAGAIMSTKTVTSSTKYPPSSPSPVVPPVSSSSAFMGDITAPLPYPHNPYHPYLNPHSPTSYLAYQSNPLHLSSPQPQSQQHNNLVDLHPHYPTPNQSSSQLKHSSNSRTTTPKPKSSNSSSQNRSRQLSKKSNGTPPPPSAITPPGHGKKLSKVSKSKKSDSKATVKLPVKLEKKPEKLASLVGQTASSTFNCNKKQKKLKDLIKDHEESKMSYTNRIESKPQLAEVEMKRFDFKNSKFEHEEEELKIDCSKISIKSEAIVSPPQPKFLISNLMQNLNCKSDTETNGTELKIESMIDGPTATKMEILDVKEPSASSLKQLSNRTTLDDNSNNEEIEEENDEDLDEDSESNTNLVIDLSASMNNSNDGLTMLESDVASISQLPTTTTISSANSSSSPIATNTSVDLSDETNQSKCSNKPHDGEEAAAGVKDDADVDTKKKKISVSIKIEHPVPAPHSVPVPVTQTVPIANKSSSLSQQPQTSTKNSSSNSSNRMAKFRKLQSYRKNSGNTKQSLAKTAAEPSPPQPPLITDQPPILVPSVAIPTTTVDSSSPPPPTSPAAVVLAPILCESESQETTPPTATTPVPGLQSNTISSTNTESSNRILSETESYLESSSSPLTTIDTTNTAITTTTSAICALSPNSMIASTPSPTTTTLISTPTSPCTIMVSPKSVVTAKKSTPAKNNSPKTKSKTSNSNCDEIAKPNSKVISTEADCDSTGSIQIGAKLSPLTIKIEPSAIQTSPSATCNRKSKTTISGKVSAKCSVKSTGQPGSATSHHRNSSSSSNKRNMNKIPIGIAIAQQRSSSSSTPSSDSSQLPFGGKSQATPITINVGAASGGHTAGKAPNFVQTLPTVLSPILITGPGLLQVSQQPHPNQQQHTDPFGTTTISGNHGHHLSTPTAYTTFHHHHHQSTNQIQTYSAAANSIPSSNTNIAPNGPSNCQIFRDSITGQLYLISAPPNAAPVPAQSSPVLATTATPNHHHHLIQPNSIKLAANPGGQAAVPGTLQLQTLPTTPVVVATPPSCISINQRNLISTSSSSSVTGSSGSLSSSVASTEHSICSSINQQQQHQQQSGANHHNTFISINSINSINSSNTTNYIINNHHSTNISKIRSFQQNNTNSNLYQHQRSTTALITDGFNLQTGNNINNDSLQPMEVETGENDGDDELIVSTNTVGFQVDMDSLHMSEDEDEDNLGRLHKLTYLNERTGEEPNEDIEDEEMIVEPNLDHESVDRIEELENAIASQSTEYSNRHQHQHHHHHHHHHHRHNQPQGGQLEPPVLPVKSAPVMQFIDSHGLDSLVDYFEEFTANSQCTSSQATTPASTPTPPAIVCCSTNSTSTNTTTYSSTGIQAGNSDHEGGTLSIRIKKNRRISENNEQEEESDQNRFERKGKDSQRRRARKARGNGVVSKRAQNESTVESEPEEDQDEADEEEEVDNSNDSEDEDSSQHFHLPFRRSERIFLSDSVKSNTTVTADSGTSTNQDLVAKDSVESSPIKNEKKTKHSLSTSSDSSLSSTASASNHLKMKIVKYKNTLSKRKSKLPPSPNDCHKNSTISCNNSSNIKSTNFDDNDNDDVDDLCKTIVEVPPCMPKMSKSKIPKSSPVKITTTTTTTKTSLVPSSSSTSSTSNSSSDTRNACTNSSNPTTTTTNALNELSKILDSSNKNNFSPSSSSVCAKEIMQCDNSSTSASESLSQAGNSSSTLQISSSQLRLKAGDLDRPNLNVIMAVDSLLFIGEICAIQAPDIYGIVLHGERQHRPLIYSQEEMLEQAMLEIKPKVSELKSGQRVCAFWSNKYRHLYPGYVREESPSSSPSTQSSTNSSLVFIEFDDGDRGTIPIDDIRLLPESYPKMELTSDPFRMFDKHNPHQASYRNRQQTKNNSDHHPHPHSHRHSQHHHKHRHHHHGGHNKKHVRSISISESFKLDDERRKQKQKEESELQQSKSNQTKQSKSPRKKVSSKKSSKSEVEDETEDNQESLESFPDSPVVTLDYKDQWNWCGKVLRVNGNRAARTRKVYYEAIKRGDDEIIKLNDSAVFVSKSRPDLPYIGRIDSMWQNSNNEMIVKVCWYYHPEETNNCPLKTNLKGALFQSYHCDVNDIQTISHKCRVVTCNEINRRHTSLRQFLLENNNRSIVEPSETPSGDDGDKPLSSSASSSSDVVTKNEEILDDSSATNTNVYFVVGHYEPLSGTFKFDKLVQEHRQLLFQQ